MKLAIIGATGLVGKQLLKILEERDFEVSELLPVASEKSVGKHLEFRGKEYKILDMKEAISAKPDMAIFSAGSKVSLEYAPAFEESGSIVIDNSSAWRLNPNHKLIVPEVNGHVLKIDDRIIANPNCSTIQLVLPLAPLHVRYRIKRIVVSTYQSVTGTGKQAVDQLFSERQNKPGPRVYPHPIDLNAIPHIDDFHESGYTKEELKIVNETRKIMNDPEIRISATCVRLPVIGGHSESVNVEFNNEFEINDIYDILNDTPGVTVMDDPSSDFYPTPLYSQGKDDVFVGRIRRDDSQPKTLNLWIVADNLRKGAATNAIQIAEYMIACNLTF